MDDISRMAEPVEIEPYMYTACTSKFGLTDAPKMFYGILLPTIKTSISSPTCMYFTIQFVSGNQNEVFFQAEKICSESCLSCLSVLPHCEGFGLQRRAVKKFMVFLVDL